MAETLQSNDQSLVDLVGMAGMEMILQQMIAANGGMGMNSSDTASSEETKTCSSLSDSHSPPDSVSANEDTPMEGEREEAVETIIDSIHRQMNNRSSPVILATNCLRESYYECFSSPNREEVQGLIYSLFVTSRGIARDGYENFECFSRTKHKCRYKVRVKMANLLYIVEERGCHSHPFDGSAFSSQGLPKQIRDVVDVSFHEGWTNQQRQDKIDELVSEMGLPPNSKMNRQIDNRLSYLRRTKNIASSHNLMMSHSLPPPLPAHPQLSALLSSESVNDISTDNVIGSIDVNALAQLMAAQQEAMSTFLATEQQQQQSQ